MFKPSLYFGGSPVLQTLLECASKMHTSCISQHGAAIATVNKLNDARNEVTRCWLTWLRMLDVTSARCSTRGRRRRTVATENRSSRTAVDEQGLWIGVDVCRVCHSTTNYWCWRQSWRQSGPWWRRPQRRVIRAAAVPHHQQLSVVWLTTSGTTGRRTSTNGANRDVGDSQPVDKNNEVREEKDSTEQVNIDAVSDVRQRQNGVVGEWRLRCCGCCCWSVNVVLTVVSMNGWWWWW